MPRSWNLAEPGGVSAQDWAAQSGERGFRACHRHLADSSAGLGSLPCLGQLPLAEVALCSTGDWPGFVGVFCLRLQWVMGVLRASCTVVRLVGGHVAVRRTLRGVALVVPLALRGAPNRVHVVAFRAGWRSRNSLVAVSCLRAPVGSAACMAFSLAPSGCAEFAGDSLTPSPGYLWPPLWFASFGHCFRIPSFSIFWWPLIQAPRVFIHPFFLQQL